MTKTILLIGQTFSGKNDFFRNLIGGGKIEDSFYPHTPIPLQTGYTRLQGKKYRVIDTPGIYTLIPNSESEIVTLNLILELQPDKIIFVTREETMATSALILIQLAELGIPFIVGYQRKNNAEYMLNSAKLTHALGAEVVVSSPVIQPNTGQIKKALARCHKPRWVGKYSPVIEKTLREFDGQFKFARPPQQKISLRFLCLLLLLGNQNTYAWLRRNYPANLSGEMLAYAQTKYEIAHSFGIVNRWASLARNLTQELWHKTPRRVQRLSYFLEKYSLCFIWDILLALTALSVLFGFVYFCGGQLLVNLFYNELFGKYVIPFGVYLCTTLCGEGFWTKLLVGPYGLLTTGAAYALAVVLPLLLSFFFIYALLENTGYIQRLELTLNRFLRLFRLNGYAVPSLLFACCKISALNQSKTLYTRKERAVSLLLLLFFIPCAPQLVIVFYLLGTIPFNYALVYVGVMLAQLVLVLNLQRLLPQQQTGSKYLSRLVPLRLPDLPAVLNRTWIYTRWYLREICPLIIGISLLLFLSDASGLLDFLRRLIVPLLEYFLDLPAIATDSLLLGLFRKDFGIASLYSLVNNQLLNSIQVLTACLFISLSAPCLGFVGEIRRQQGWGKALLVLGASTIYAFTIAALVNKIIRI